MSNATKTVTRWEELKDLYQDQFSEDRNLYWIFRGQQRSCWKLETSLERDLRDHGYSGTSQDIAGVESQLLREFQRRAHHYLQQLPEQWDTLQWLALMRHFGAPTRLLDCTYSFWVAVFFAIEEKTRLHLDLNDRECTCGYSLWAIDGAKLRAAANKKLGAGDSDAVFQHDGSRPSADKFDAYFRPQASDSRARAITPFVYHVNPFILNERITAQQGVFLCPGDVSQSFDSNLTATGAPADAVQRIEIRIDVDGRCEFLRNLRRMTITRAALFPGLQGFAQSLRTLLASRELLQTTAKLSAKA